MRKITREAVNHFIHGRKYSNGNTVTDGTVLWLHGNTIAMRESGSSNIKITLAGWNTNTTRERLNGIPGVSVRTKQGQPYLNGAKWDGEWIEVGQEHIQEKQDEALAYFETA